jgi:hypothetical protein
MSIFTNERRLGLHSNQPMGEGALWRETTRHGDQGLYTDATGLQGQFQFRIKLRYSYIRDHRIYIHLRIWVILGISLPGIYLVEHKFV